MVDSPDEKSVLVERLLRLQSEPVGVINLKQFQTQLARVPSWMVQRSRFLERWQSRYAFGESEPGSGTELMLATPVQPITTEPNLTSQLSSAMLSERIYQEKIAPPREKISDSQAGQTFRLSRKAVPLAPDSNSLSKQVNSSEKIDAPANTSEKNSPSLRTIVESVTVSNPDSKPAVTLAQPQRTVAPKEEETKVTLVELKQIQVSNLSTPNPLLLRQNLQQPDETSEEKKIDSLTATSGESPLPLRTITERINTSTSNSESAEISLKPETKVTAIEQGQSLVSDEAITNPLLLRQNLQQPDETSEEKKIDSLTATSGESPLPLRTITERINTSTSNSESAEISLKPETKVTAIEQGQSLVSDEAITNPLLLRQNLQQPDETSEEKKIDSLTATSGESPLPLRTITERINNPTSNSESAATLDQSEAIVASTEGETKVTSVELGQPQVSNLSTATPLLLRQSLQSLDKESNRLTTGSGTIHREAIGGQKQSGNQANRDIAAVNSELATTSIAVVPEIPSREVPGNLSIPTNLVWRKTTSEPARTVFSAANNGYTDSSLPSVSIPVNPNRPNILRQMSNTASEMEAMPSNPAIPAIAQTANQTPVVNVADIAEQVSRLLFRQLTVERERRGISQWY
ncbi:hypothetical protein H6G48_24980 [Microcystis flos-aquae FACHB-1344]|uniref:Uncharacterized protein n=1 Tax=Microcystis flos-aquae FACHB-1344 TaxID=2692899 RepID=A0ABR8I1D5_9CHRO|nr:hypothetical protein [Microcystis flos-aquae]MBD2624732.1 hypothetical protein [Microcystis flos-aquae FACHB-1344]